MYVTRLEIINTGLAKFAPNYIQTRLRVLPVSYRVGYKTVSNVYDADAIREAIARKEKTEMSDYSRRVMMNVMTGIIKALDKLEGKQNEK